MFWRKLIICGFIAICAKVVFADIVVQLNINRPINDVSDKFVSFTMKPEDLYEALDGSHRKTITRMASMLSYSHIKFVGDYYFASQVDTKLRNPNKIVWKGFNKWTKAIKWSMIIPVPYTPNSWDPMHTLKILNNSQTVGISDCIWQLGTDFGSSAALDYVTELKTFKLMVESYRHSVNNWQIMGADISAGSCPDETRRYIEMSRDLNVAYGWIESSDTFMGNSLTSALNEQDPALKVLFKEKVPVWLTLPKDETTKMISLDSEVYDGLNWAQTMGDAANAGFNTIFQHIAPSDWESPKYSFYVTALFKKIMGSRVFPARPLGLFGRTNKLYTHCANDVSGGLAFMVVNKQDDPMQIVIRSTSKLQDTELWQYVLTMTNGYIRLNNRRLNINSTLQPDIRRKQTQSMPLLKTPGVSVTFWVLPNVNIEHCQFTEAATSKEMENDMSSEQERYSSSDRLLKELIKDSAIASSSSGRKIYRHRRSLDTNERLRRFILENGQNGGVSLTNFASNIAKGVKLPFKGDIFSPERRRAALEWLSQIVKAQPLGANFPLLRRTTRNSDGYVGPFFMTRDGKKTAFTKKATDIKKPEKKPKRLYEDLEFDEEKFFKSVDAPPEPDYVKIPEGDVFLQNIASVNSDDDAEKEMKIERVKESNRAQKSKVKKEIVSEMKPLRLLPTEFYEALPVQPSKPIPNKLNLGSPMNSLFFPDSLGNKFGKDKSNFFGKNVDLKEDSIKTNIEEPENSKDADDDLESTQNDDFIKAQINIRENVFSKRNKEEQNTKHFDDSVENSESATTTNTKGYLSDMMPDSNYNFFGDTTKSGYDKTTTPSEETTAANGKFEELPWWDLSPRRLKRSLGSGFTANIGPNNMVTKDVEPIVSANELSPRRLHAFEYKVDEALRTTKKRGVENDESIGQTFVNAFTHQVAKLVDAVSQHVNEWYNTASK